MCIHCSLRKQKCRLKSTTTNGWRHFGQSEQRKSSALFPIQSEKSPDSGIFTCDPTKKCIMPSSRERHKGIIGRGHDLRLGWGRGDSKGREGFLRRVLASPHLYRIFTICSIDSCQNKIATDQYPMSISRAHVSTHRGDVIYFRSCPLTS